MIIFRPYIVFTFFAISIFFLYLIDIRIDLTYFVTITSCYSSAIIFIFGVTNNRSPKGDLILRRRKQFLRYHDIIVLFYLLALLKLTIYNYYLILLLLYLFIYLYFAIVTNISTPIQLAITNDLIIYRDCWFKKIKTSEIKKITFAEGGDKITVHFTDGLDNIELLIKEYEFNELISCIKYLTSNPENKFEVSDILINYYFQKNN